MFDDSALDHNARDGLPAGFFSVSIPTSPGVKTRRAVLTRTTSPRYRFSFAGCRITARAATAELRKAKATRERPGGFWRGDGDRSRMSALGVGHHGRTGRCCHGLRAVHKSRPKNGAERSAASRVFLMLTLPCGTRPPLPNAAR
jgi:hypothetical protein